MGRRNRGGGRGGGGEDMQHSDRNNQGGNRRDNNQGGNQNNNNQGGHNNRGGHNNNRGGRGNNNNFSNRGNHNNHNNRDNQERNNNQNRSNDSQGNHSDNRHRSQNIRCSRCEKNGHEAAACTAREVPEQSRCDCGNPFHYPNQCPYSGDPAQRQETLTADTGYFCTWCKDAGDGRHTFDDCVHARKFKHDLMQVLRQTYNVLQWCWHCGNTNHREFACKGTQATLDLELWTAKINEVIMGWTGYSEVDFSHAYRDNELDVMMEEIGERKAPPVAATFLWCIMCEEFGHATNTRPRGCETAKWESRAPPKLKTSRVQVPRSSNAQVPFAPSGFGPPNSSVSQSRMLQCINPGCTKLVGPWTFPMPRFGQTLTCPACYAPNTHPDSHRDPSNNPSQLAQATELITLITGIQHSGSSKLKPQPQNPHLQDLYLKRPSLKLQWTLRRSDTLSSLNSATIRNFHYTDLHASRPDISPVLYNSGQYFSNYHPHGTPHFAWGNFQEYFPAITFEITPDMWADATDVSLAINRAGQQGLEARCSGCACPVVVLDGEWDVVMCGTGWANTVGEGRGSGYYWRRDGSVGLECECLSIVGQRGSPVWVDWRTGREV